MAIRRSGAVIVDRIYRTRERKKKITEEEMNAVIEERDAALAQVSPSCFLKDSLAAVHTSPPLFTLGKMNSCPF